MDRVCRATVHSIAELDTTEATEQAFTTCLKIIQISSLKDASLSYLSIYFFYLFLSPPYLLSVYLFNISSEHCTNFGL